MAKRRQVAREILDRVLDSWGGGERSRPGPGQGRGEVVRLFRPVDGEELLVGELRREGGEWLFEYADEYVQGPDPTPISGFPDLAVEYRAKRLWPFFTVRMPPTSRADVQDYLRRHDIHEVDELRLLGTLGQRAVASPYVFRLVEKGA